MMRNKAEAGTLSECMPLDAVPSSNQSNKHGTKVPTTESMINNGAGVLTPLKNNTTEVPTPEGYKQTKVGVIPEEWEVVRLGDVCKQKAKYGINAPAVPFNKNLPKYLRITDIDENGKFNPIKIVSVNHKDYRNYILQEGDIVFARTGATVGKSYLYNKKDGELIYAGYLIKISPDKKFIDSTFLKNFINTSFYWNWIQIMSMRSGQPGVNAEEYSLLPLPLPPLKEQQKIAQILSTWDRAIEQQEALITAKEELKKGLMQKLLSGEIRFEGFDGEWEEVRLGDLCTIKTGTSKSKFQSQDGKYFIVDMGSISRTGKLTPTKKTSHDKDILNKYDLIMPKDDIGGGQIIGRTAMIDMDDKYIMGDHIYLLKVEKDDPHFIHYAINSFRVNKSFRRKATGTAQLGLNKKSVEKQNILLPKVKQEQQKIAQVLTTADKEITLLKEELEVLKEQKRGLMQRLLSGEVRVKMNEGEKK